MQAVRSKLTKVSLDKQAKISNTIENDYIWNDVDSYRFQTKARLAHSGGCSSLVCALCYLKAWQGSLCGDAGHVEAMLATCVHILLCA